MDRILVVGHFALDGGEPQTLSAMGKVVGLSRERIRKMRVLTGILSVDGIQRVIAGRRWLNENGVFRGR